jgi:ribonuclease P protein subunit POP4
LRYTSRNLKCHELIGLEVTVLDHSSKSLSGISGRVVWETKNMLVIEGEGRELMVPKLHGRFSFKLPSGDTVVIDGGEILGRPEERPRRCG